MCIYGPCPLVNNIALLTDLLESLKLPAHSCPSSHDTAPAAAPLSATFSPSIDLAECSYSHLSTTLPLLSTLGRPLRLRIYPNPEPP